MAIYKVNHGGSFAYLDSETLTWSSQDADAAEDLNTFASEDYLETLQIVGKCPIYIPNVAAQLLEIARLYLKVEIIEGVPDDDDGPSPPGLVY